MKESKVPEVKIHECLVLAEEMGKRIIKCAGYGFEYCAPQENYKQYALMCIKPVVEGTSTTCEPKVYLDEGWELREYYCSVCAVMIDNELAVRGEVINPFF